MKSREVEEEETLTTEDESTETVVEQINSTYRLLRPCL